MTHQPIGTVCDCGEPGWMPGVEHAPIRWDMPAYNRSALMRPTIIVDHIMQGYLSTMVDWTVSGASRVIVHFGIGRGGRIVQMHSIFAPGIHAGPWNPYSIAIEHEGCSVDPRPDYEVPAELIYGEDNPWQDAMVRASVRVKRWCFSAASSLGLPSRRSIVGHYENGDPSRIDDPAAAAARDVWPVARMIAALTEQEDDMPRRIRMDTVEKVAAGRGLREALSERFADVANNDPLDGWEVERGDAPDADVLILTLPKGTVFK